MKHLKMFGQHFLNNTAIAQKIVESLANDLIMESPATVFEIGPGEGVLTQYLLDYKQSLTPLFLIEIDQRLPAVLLQKFEKQGLKTEQIINESVLDINFTKFLEHPQAPFALIGNFPYNISSQILFKMLDYKQNAMQMVGMFQKEVAERICAQPNSKAYGIVSVLLQAYYQAQYLFTVDKKEFTPPPKVQSAIVHLKRHYIYEAQILNYSAFAKVVKAAFSQRRKKLSNALKNNGFDIQNIPLTYLNQRAEQLSITQFIELYKILTP